MGASIPEEIDHCNFLEYCLRVEKELEVSHPHARNDDIGYFFPVKFT